MTIIPETTVKVCAYCGLFYPNPTAKRSPCCGDCWYDPEDTMSTTTETTTVVTGEAATTAIAVTAMAWVTAFALVIFWWRDLGLDRFETFVARTMIVGTGALGVTLVVIVAALFARKP